jgi:hypothetical protein
MIGSLSIRRNGLYQSSFSAAAPDAFAELYGNRQIIMQRVAALRLPAIYQFPEEAEEGGFVAYGPRLIPIFRDLMAQQLAKLLRGVKPADIPIEQPTRLATSPLPTGSPLTANTIGMTDVARLAAIVGGVAPVTMTLTLSRTNSAANSLNARRAPPPNDIRFRQYFPRSNRVHAAVAQTRQ